MLVTNKLLIPCRVLDSHFCRLSNSTLPPMPPPRPPPHGRVFLFQYLLPFSIQESRFSPTAAQLLLLLPMYILSFFVRCCRCCRCRRRFPPVDPPAARLASRPRPTRSTTATPPSDATFLASLTRLVLFSPVLLLYKSRRGLYACTDVPSAGLERAESRSKGNYICTRERSRENDALVYARSP